MFFWFIPVLNIFGFEREKSMSIETKIRIMLVDDNKFNKIINYIERKLYDIEQKKKGCYSASFEGYYWDKPISHIYEAAFSICNDEDMAFKVSGKFLAKLVEDCVNMRKNWKEINGLRHADGRYQAPVYEYGIKVR